MKDRKFTIRVPFECSLIECNSKDCNMKFILHAVLIPDEKHRDECEDTIMPQAKVYYCPYCGKKQDDI